jgi:hypothetical protein
MVYLVNSGVYYTYRIFWQESDLYHRTLSEDHKQEIWKTMLLKKKWEKKGGRGKKVTCPQVLVFCYMYIAIAFRNSVRNVVTKKK